jgi:thioredoxin 1
MAVDTGAWAAYIGGSEQTGRVERPAAKELSMSTVKVTDESFEKDVLQAAGPVLVDFWAEWCGPCKQIAPALEQISEELGGQVTVAKLNIEESPTTPSRYGVRGIPTMMLFKGGQMASMKVGAMPKQKILEWLNEAGVAA